MRPKIFQFFLVAAIFSLLGYYVGVSKVNFEWKNYKPQISIINREPPSSLTTVDLAPFWTVWQKLENSYYDKKVLDPKKLLEGAISGMVESLEDPYTVYLPPNQNSEFKQGLAGTFSGIGAELGMEGKQIIIVAPLDESPAQKAGLKPQDAILKVDGKQTLGWTLSQAVEKIRGPKGTEVALLILHKNEEKPVDIKITRDTILVKSVTAYVKQIKDIESIKEDSSLKNKQNEKIAYIRLSQFGDNTNKEWLSAINKLSFDIAKDNVKGLILDLRNNPGGYLQDATFIASEFLKNGVIVFQDGGNDNITTFSINRKGLLTEIPLIVLINKGSASASEIVASALNDHKRAKLVGETSFGKGTIQQAEDLGGGAGIHITIAKWLTPKKEWINGKGITPDISVSFDPKSSVDTQLARAVSLLIQ